MVAPALTLTMSLKRVVVLAAATAMLQPGHKQVHVGAVIVVLWPRISEYPWSWWPSGTGFSLG